MFEQTLLQKEVKMANKHMKKFLAPLAMRELQIKATMRNHYVPIKMKVLLCRQTIISSDEDEKQLKLSHFSGGNTKWHNQSMAASYKVKYRKSKIHLPYKQALLLLGCHPTEMKTYVHTITCTWEAYVNFIQNLQNQEKTQMSYHLVNG